MYVLSKINLFLSKTDVLHESVVSSDKETNSKNNLIVVITLYGSWNAKYIRHYQLRSRSNPYWESLRFCLEF